MDNPYASPADVPQPEHTSAWITQARVVAILLLIQGVGEIVVGFLLVYQWKKTVLDVSIICFVFALAVLKVIAGVRNYQQRNYTLGMIALGVAPLSVLTCFCVPSALAIMLYGLVVYLHRDVRHAFALGGLEK